MRPRIGDNPCKTPLIAGKSSCEDNQQHRQDVQRLFREEVGSSDSKHGATIQIVEDIV